MGDKSQHAVFVGNLPNDADSDELNTVFRVFGKVNNIRIMDGKTGGKYAFVTYAEEQSAMTAIAYKGHKYKDLAITVRPATKRRDVAKESSRDQGQGMTRSGMNKFNINQNRPDLVSTVPAKRSPHTSGDGSSSSVWKQNIDLQPGEKVTIIATHVESPTTFYGQIKDKIKQQDVLKMFQILASLCNSCEAFSGIPELDKVYAAKFSQDGNWYRCKVLSLKDDGQCEIQYIDYGNKEVVKNDDLRVIPSKQVTKPYAIRCSLFGLRNAYDCETIGYLRGVEKLESLILDKEIEARVAHIYNPALHKLLLPLEVKCEDKDVNSEMVEAGFAVRSSNRVDPLSSRGQESKPAFGRSLVDHKISDAGEDGQTGLSNHRSFQTSSLDNVQCQGAPTIDTWEPNKAVTTPGRTQNSMAVSSAAQKQTQDTVLRLQTELANAASEIGYLKNELVKYQRHCEELRHLEKERNEAFQECNKMKADFRTLESQLENVIKRLQESSLNKRLKVLLVGVNKIKHLRLQFPSECQTQDNIEWAGELLLDTQNRISLANLQVKKDVDQLKNDYEIAQANIKACVEQSELDNLIKVRDDCRKALHTVLIQFDETVRQLPLEKRRHTLQRALSAIQKTHSNFLKPDINGNMKLMDVLNQYHNWKAQKMIEFREKRVQTNTCHNLLNGSLNLLQQELALDSLGSGSSSLTAANLDDSINKYTAAVYDEINVTDVENSADSPLITMVLKILIKEICSELADIDQLLSLHEASWTLAQQLEEWLDGKPDLTTLNGVRKTIKSIKSKLRHKLADKQDLEESDECDKDELICVEKEVSLLREELQQAFAEEDQCLVLLAKLCVNHFPELVMQYPDAGIEVEVEYRGLFKPGRTLEYFSVEPLKGCDKPSVMRSTYCRKAVVLKEFIVDDTHSVQKADFLREAMTYSSVESPNLTTVEMVFSLKDKRNLYIQLPYYETTIHDIVASGIPSPKILHSVLSGVLHGLSSLHEARVIHGAVHPNNVFVDSQNGGILAEFDFAKTLVQRFERKYTTANGLSFVPPEGSTTGQLSETSDVYCFGLLALWLVTEKNSRVPSLDNISTEDSDLLDMLHATLCDNPQRRPTAGQLLSFPYFINVPDDLSSCPVNSSPELLTLQLRPKQSSPPVAERNHTGILKNGSQPASPTSGGGTISCPEGETDTAATAPSNAPLVEVEGSKQNQSSVTSCEEACRLVPPPSSGMAAVAAALSSAMSGKSECGALGDVKAVWLLDKEIRESLPQLPSGMMASPTALANMLADEPDDGVDKNAVIAESSDKEVCDIFTMMDQSGCRCPDVLTDIPLLEENESAADREFGEEEAFGFERTCKADIPTLPASDVVCANGFEVDDHDQQTNCRRSAADSLLPDEDDECKQNDVTGPVSDEAPEMGHRLSDPSPSSPSSPSA